jgi:site-specific recombinase XerD
MNIRFRLIPQGFGVFLRFLRQSECKVNIYLHFVGFFVATVFRPSGSDTWVAAFRVWDAAKGKYVWRQKGTGVTDKAQAAGIAATLEQASGAAKAGTMTKERALEMVNDILRLAGISELVPVPSLAECAKAFLDAANVSAGTRRKYSAQWTSLAKWAGKRASEPVQNITIQDMQDYYDATRKKFSATTAGDHLNFASMMFGRAMNHGHRAGNPCAGVVRATPDAVEKLHLTRAEHAVILRQCRKVKRKDWTALCSLGWHTGHRLQDLLDVTAASISGDLVTLQPRKKGRQGGRTVVLPLPNWLALRVTRLGNFKTIFHADNRNGKASERFIQFMRKGGIDPQPKMRGVRVVHLKSFHSYRHSMTTRLTSAGVSGELARLVTDHDDVQIQRRYTHREVESLRGALAKARRR